MPQACALAIQVTPVAPIVPVQDTWYNELKAAMGAKAALIAALIANKENKSIEEDPQADEVYSESLPEKYKHQTFIKFDGEGNPMDYITIFKIECGFISTNGKLNLQQVPSSLSGSELRWFNSHLAGSIKTWEELIP